MSTANPAHSNIEHRNEHSLPMGTPPPLYSRPAHGLLVLQEEEPSEDDEADNAFPGSMPGWPHSITTRFRRHRTYFESHDWRSPLSCETNNGVLVMCLNIGVDPPNIPRPPNRGRMECWFEPDLTASQKSASIIKDRIHEQYKRWHSLGRFKATTDPTLLEVQKICRNARKNAKNHRVMFHYNGHGVPWPTPTGEIWMFNSNFTKYLPFNLSDLHSLIRNPSLYIFDCDHAGLIVNYFRQHPMDGQHYPGSSNQHRLSSRDTDNPFPDEDCIVLGSCGKNEQLPFDPALPADLFTSCLTTPIRTALMFYAGRSLITGITPEMIDKIPGDIESRNTPIGDLARIFTTISDTIAWNILPPAMFRRLFRQDLLLASLMRNFLLACRIMSFYDRTPVSVPSLPQSHNHPLWESFEYTMEQYLAQVPSNFRMQKAAQAENEYRQRFISPSTDTIDGNNKASLLREESLSSGYMSSYCRYRIPFQAGHGLTSGPVLTHNLTYESSSFFEDQIKAFEVWLDMDREESSLPEQLPILLLLVIQGSYRKQGLHLIARFLQIGPHAVDAALSIGIFPYMLKYLSKPNPKLISKPYPELMPNLVLIWGKILAHDPKCCIDLGKIGAHNQFVKFLKPRTNPDSEPSGVHLAVGLFIESVFGSHVERAYDYHKDDILSICLYRMSHDDPLVRRWACLCMAKVLTHCKFDTTGQAANLLDYVDTIAKYALSDEVPDVRAAGVSAIAEILYKALKLDRNATEAVRARLALTIDRTSTVQPYSVNSRGDYSPHDYSSLESNHVTRTVSGVLLGSTSSHIMEAPSHSSTVNCVDEQRAQTALSNGHASVETVTVGVEGSSKAATVATQLVNKVGSILAQMGLNNSSVLVRREVAIALTGAVHRNTTPFVNAAQERGRNVWRSGEKANGISSYLGEEMKSASNMWVTLVELAFDPHPVVASHARESFDIISANICANFSDDGDDQNKSGESVTPQYNPLMSQSYESQRSNLSDHENGPAVIHVRGSSGRIDLNPLVPRAVGRIPRVNSASLMNLNELDSGTPNSVGYHFPRFLMDEPDNAFESPPGSRLIAGLSSLIRTMPFGQPPAPQNTTQRNFSGNGMKSREGSLSNIDRFSSPHRPQRRSRSYQVIAPGEIGTFGDCGQPSVVQSRPPVEKAVDSLLAWSSVCMSTVAFDSNGPDHMPVPDPVPQYTKLWDNVLNPKDGSHGSRYLASAMACLAEGVPREANNCSLNNFTERGTFLMGAGGGSVISMAFLPREVGREGDQYIVTGDSTGTVGVYDALDGQCQSAFGIPGPPGIPDVDVTSVMCLNGQDADGGGLSVAQHTPLILAGSYDGRVAVFRSDLVSKKYSVLSSFQASGGSLWAKLRREHFGQGCPVWADRSRGGILGNSRAEKPGAASRAAGMASLLRSSGNGLVLGFRNSSASLFSAGCEDNEMKVWDLSQETCSWQGRVTSKGVWATAISVPPWEWFHNIVVVGASDGSVSLIDTRMPMTTATKVGILGLHSQPVVSTAHGLWNGEERGETIVSADCEGNIILWDPRKHKHLKTEAHNTCLATMAAHPSGNFIASGSLSKCVKVFRASTSETNNFMIRDRRNRYGMKERLAPVTSLTFHQQEYTLAIGCYDGTVTMYGNA